MPVVNRITKELIACGVIGASRYYLYFDGNTLIPLGTLSIPSQFKVTMTIIPSIMSDMNFLFGESFSSGIYCRLTSTGVALWVETSSTGKVSWVTSDLADGKEHTLEFYFNAGSVVLVCDGVDYGERAVNTVTTAVINIGGTATNGRYFRGYMAYFNFNDQIIIRFNKNTGDHVLDDNGVSYLITNYQSYLWVKK
jgi:hypothetical protein